MMRADHFHGLEPLTLLAAQWQLPSLERGWVFSKIKTKKIAPEMPLSGSEISRRKPTKGLLLL